jgi:glycosyltransferase involved in cell wall biosynthesis
MDRLFSIIVPTYNRAELLRAALDSVLAQTFSDYEVIVVDDGSTDATATVVGRYGNRVRLLRQSNQGPGAARTLGAAQANGEYLAFLDSDDVFFPWSLTRYAEIIRQGGFPSFVAGKPFRFTGAGPLPNATDEDLKSIRFPDYYASGDDWRWFGVSSFVVRRQTFQSVGGFTNQWINGEDADLAMKLGESQGFVQVKSPYTFGYREHAASAKRNTDKTLAGVRHKIDAEKSGRYPGGAARRRERIVILTRHIRPLIASGARQGAFRETSSLYLRTFWWHVKLGRWKCLLGFPLMAAAAGVLRRPHPPGTE